MRKPAKRPKRAIVAPRGILPSGRLLDTISEERIRRGARLGKNLERYAAQEFAALAQQRSEHADAIRAALVSASQGPLPIDKWYRVVKAKYANHPLSLTGSTAGIGSRFNAGNIDPGRFPQFPALYIGQEAATVIAEVFLGETTAPTGMTPDEMALANASSFTCVRVSGTVDSHVDLFNFKQLATFIDIIGAFTFPPGFKAFAKKLGVIPRPIVADLKMLQATLLDPNWRYQPRQEGVPANTQIFGQLVQDAGIQAIRYPSVRDGGGQCLAIFPQNFAGTLSTIELIDDHPDTVIHRRLDSGSLKDFC